MSSHGEADETKVGGMDATRSGKGNAKDDAEEEQLAHLGPRTN